MNAIEHFCVLIKSAMPRTLPKFVMSRAKVNVFWSDWEGRLVVSEGTGGAMAILTLPQPGGTDYSQQVTTTPKISELPTALEGAWYLWGQHA